jgi:hypothetical protein
MNDRQTHLYLLHQEEEKERGEVYKISPSNWGLPFLTERGYWLLVDILCIAILGGVGLAAMIWKGWL